MPFTAAVYGLGNIGRYALDAFSTAPDASCLGIIRRPASVGKGNAHNLPEFASVEDLIKAKGKPDAILLATPSRDVPALAKSLLAQGIATVDSFDIHGEIPHVFEGLNSVAKDGKAVSLFATGWDPGTDSVLRALFEAMVPTGTSFTNFGRGRSMGHSVAARAIKGVADACSLTLPLGGGRHSRLVYVVLEKNANFEQVKAAIAADDYFAHDPLEVRQVTAEEMPYVADASHGVKLERLGASGTTSNQRLEFDMRINNPALTAQVMLSAARAACRLKAQGNFGAFTLIDIAPVLLLPGERMANIARLV